MAYVALSDSTKSSIRSTLNNMYAKELQALGRDDVILDKIKALDSLRMAVDAALWGEFIDLKDRLDKLSRNGEVPVEWLYAVDNGDGRQEQRSEGVVLDRMRVPIVVRMSHWNRVEKPAEVKGSEILSDPLFMELRNLRQAQHECTQRWNKVIAQVMNFLEKCKSLNEAVKLWPDIRRYVPRDLQERLDFKPAREKSESDAAEALKALDLDAINTSTVLARMAGSGAA